MDHATPKPYLRTPTLSPDGRLVAFVHAADIWLAPADGGDAERISAHPAGHFAPRFSPDGSALAFSSNRTGGGDIYVLPLGGGETRRVTFHDSAASVEDWSPDGAHLYFSSHRERTGGALFRVPVAGGTPLELLAEPGENLAHLQASPDGELLAFNNTRGPWWRRGPNPFAPSDIWLAPAAPRALAHDGPPALRRMSTFTGMNRWPLWHPDGSGIYFVSDRDGAENIWFQPLEGDEARPVTRFRDGRVLWPAIARRAGTIVFEREWGLWRLDPASGEAAPLELRVRGDTRLTPVRVDTYTRVNELRLAPDGKKIAFVARGEVFADFADKETDREQRQGPAFRLSNTPAREREVVWAPSSRRVYYLSDRHGEDEIFQYDFAARAETRLSDDPAPKALPTPSPDGKWLAFLRGYDEIHLLDTATGAVRPFAQGSFITAGALAWSPDSRWLAFFSQDDRMFTNVYVQQIDETQSRQVTFLSNLSGETLHWAPNGRFLILTSAQYREEHRIARVDLRPVTPIFREAEFEKLFEEQPTAKPGDKETAEPGDKERARQGDKETAEQLATDGPAQKVEESDQAQAQASKQPQSSIVNRQSPIVFEGIERRLRFLTPPQMDAVAQAISPDSRDLLFTASVADKVNVWSLALDEPRHEQPPRQLTYTGSGKRAVQFAPDGKLFFYLDEWQITSRKFPNGDGAVTIGVRADVVVDFQQEKRQIFDEAWRAMRDAFYDEGFGGSDWPAVRARFAPAVAGAQTSGDLHAILRLMLGELRASHLDVSAGGGPSGDGYMGLRFDPVELAESGALRVADVVPDSPAALALDMTGEPAPVRVGEYLLSVDGTALAPGVTLDQLLSRSVGRRVVLRLAEAPEGEPREAALRPVDGGSYERLRYRAWVGACKAYVARASGGRLGYVHIPQMSYAAYQQFLADLDAETYGKEGVVIDVRNNGGGHTATFILDVLLRPSILRSSFRGRRSIDDAHLAGNRVLGRPTALVTNEHSGSNTEMLSESYRRLGLGPVVGKPTAGAVIWTWSTRLLDGSLLRLPRMRITTPEGEDLEGRGRPVDVEADKPLGEWARGIDRQLDAAVAALLARIDNGASGAI
jgi:Tol biopolymer transport system component/C-terminal processing protease CtpA/Prc